MVTPSNDTPILAASCTCHAVLGGINIHELLLETL